MHIKEILLSETDNFIDNSEYMIVDVRENNEFTEGHIRGALNFPLSNLKNTYRNLPNDKNLILVCRSGSRSLTAYSFLKDQGYDNLINLKGGMSAWLKARHPYVEGIE